MARTFRYFEKKRGHRRTGSRIVGSVGEALFFAVLFVVGCAGIVAGIVRLIIPEWRVNHGFVEQTCTVLEANLGERNGENGVVYRPEIKIEYEAHGITYRPPITYDIHNAYSSNREEAQEVLRRFVKRQKYSCWYDPANPDVAVLVRGYQWWIWPVLLIPASFLTIGAGGLIYSIFHWGRSAERRAARVQRAVRQQDLLDFDRPVGPKLPNVPDSSDISSSPGTKLAYRLPLSRSPAWALFGLLGACVAWNGAVSYFTVTAVRGFLARQPDWFLTLFTLPFLAAGVVLLVVFVRQLLVTTGIGPTRVEISAHPLLPGGCYRLFLSQSGRLTMESIEVSLVCEEEAIYRQGTNTRTETREVSRQPLLSHGKFQIRQGEPFEVECELNVPPTVMHSFKSNHNAIRWKVVIRGDVAKWPRFERAFPVIVHPCGSPAAKDRSPA